MEITSRQKRIIKTIISASLVFTALFLIGFVGISKKKEPTPTPIVITSPKITPAFTDFHLVIPSLEISAPVIADVNGSDKEAYLSALQNGVAHFSGTSKPGGGSNIFIFGHSSYYAWDKGNYKTIFLHLGDLKEGDEISLWLNSKEYKYIVSDKKTVDPSEVSVLKPTPTEQLSIMTCWPPGTTAERLIIIAKPKK